eukprot:TRINITY_DN7709_c0_g1_i1.p1 TRINITY_DN7709_c0_g1~~TRINITY_DN7709_c0_g1_i1.p1  ORF type:complete len:455 (+),score=116.12 TRINITY_DN7709_c0_g1_i1:25-1365(+)
MTDYTELRSQLSAKATIVTSKHDDYDARRTCWNMDRQSFPAAIVVVGSVDDVVATVNYSRVKGLNVCVSGGRHSPYCMMSDAFVIDLRLLDSVTVDEGARTATVGGGVKLAKLDEATSKVGLATVAGHNGDTGVGGLTLGGGVGYITRKYGMTIDHLRSVTVVTAAGEVVVADKDNHQDLFWALRGGAGNFGVAVSFVFGLFPMKDVFAGDVIKPLTIENLRNSVEEAKKLPREASVFVGLMFVPPGMPGAGSPCLLTQCTYLGSQEEGEKVFAPIRSFGTNFVDSMRVQPYLELQKTLGDRQPHAHYYEKGCLVNDLALPILEYAVANFPSCPSKGAMLGLMQVGGAMADVAPEATAFRFRAINWWVLIVGRFAPDAEGKNRDDIAAWTRDVASEFEKYDHQSYANVIGDTTTVAKSIWGDNLPRLERIKALYDPHLHPSPRSVL